MATSFNVIDTEPWIAKLKKSDGKDYHKIRDALEEFKKDKNNFDTDGWMQLTAAAASNKHTINIAYDLVEFNKFKLTQFPSVWGLEALIQQLKNAKQTEASDLWKPFRQLMDDKTFDNESWFKLACAAAANRYTVDLAYRMVDHNGLKLKLLPNSATTLYKILWNKPDLSDLKGDFRKQKSDCYEHYYNLSQAIFKSVKETTEANKTAPITNEFVQRLFENYNLYDGAIAYGCYELNNWTLVEPGKIERHLGNIRKMIMEHPDGEWYWADEQGYLGSLFVWMFAKLFQGIKLAESHKKCIDICRDLWVHTFYKVPMFDDNGHWSLGGSFCFHFITTFLSTNLQSPNTDLLVSVVDPALGMVDWIAANNPEDNWLKNISTTLLMVIATLIKPRPKLAGPQIETHVRLALEHANFSYFDALTTVYPDLTKDQQNLMHKHAGEFMEIATTKDTKMAHFKTHIFMMFCKMVPNGLDLRADIPMLQQYFGDVNTVFGVLQLLVQLVKKYPDCLEGQGENWLTDAKANLPNVNATWYFCELYKLMGMLSQKEAERVLRIMEKNLQGPDENNLAHTYYLMIIRSFAEHKDPQYAEMVKLRRKSLEQMASTPALKQMAESLLDYLAGRSLKNLDVRTTVQGGQINSLGERVKGTEQQVDYLDTQVSRHTTEIGENREGIRQTQRGLTDVTKRVDVAEVDIDELNNRTVSNAPKWSSKVSPLLNSRSDHDWRLLAQRLGYSVKDVRNWATQPNPCMSLLSEWFATHKTSEATHAVLTELTEMGRFDASRIIEESLRTAEDVIDEPQEIFSKPPEIFLSYQWGIQPQVKLLKKYLTDAGYNCWLDIGQMGGGDSLYQKIDSGIRGAKVVLLCCTKLYTTSANCTREVNLANSVNKPIIPLMIEKIDWPPAGSMGPILADKLFIRFFQRDNEKTNDERFWPPEMYNQLLAQIEPHINAKLGGVPIVAPKQSETARPPARERSFEPSAKTSDKATILILCCFESQVGMSALGKRLEQKGHKCDLARVDSTGTNQRPADYDAIICAITKTFYQSQQARRKLNEADQSRRPLVPLLLDKLQWSYISQTVPPLARYSPIDCVYADSRRWDGDEFDQICDKLQRYGRSADSSTRPPSVQKSSRSNLPRMLSTGSTSSDRGSIGGAHRGNYGNRGGYNQQRQRSFESNEQHRNHSNDPDQPKLSSVYRQQRRY